MRPTLRILATAAALALAVLTGPVYACDQEYDEIYYNSSGCWQGERFVSCMPCGHVSITGSLTGAHWKLISTETCEGQPLRYDWYVWDGSAWVATSDPGLPGC